MSLTVFGLAGSVAAAMVLSGGNVLAALWAFPLVMLLSLYRRVVPLVSVIVGVAVAHLLLQFWSLAATPAEDESTLSWPLQHLGALVVTIAITMAVTRLPTPVDAPAGAAEEAAGTRERLPFDLLLDLLRRDRTMYARQLEIVEGLEEREHDPDVLTELFNLEHLVVRARRHAESVLLLCGEDPSRGWPGPIPLRDVVRAAIAETEDIGRVLFDVDEQLAVSGRCAADVVHLVAELVENAVRTSPANSSVAVRSRPSLGVAGPHLVVVEDAGPGMTVEEMHVVDDVLSGKPVAGLAGARYLGYHVVARLADRHAIQVSLTSTPGGGLTAVIELPVAVLTSLPTSSGPASGSRSSRLSKLGIVGTTSARPSLAAAVSGSSPGEARHIRPDQSDAAEGQDRGAQRATREERALIPAAADAVTGSRPAADSLRAPAAATPERGAQHGLLTPRSVPPPPAPPSASPPPSRLAERTAPSTSAPAGSAAPFSAAPSFAAAPAPAPPSAAPPPTTGADATRVRDVAGAAVQRQAASRHGELERRVPQAHLAPELLRSASGRPLAPGGGGAARRAAAASSLDAFARLQSSRELAHREIDGERTALDGRSDEEETS